MNASSSSAMQALIAAGVNPYDENAVAEYYERLQYAQSSSAYAEADAAGYTLPDGSSDVTNPYADPTGYGDYSRGAYNADGSAAASGGADGSAGDAGTSGWVPIAISDANRINYRHTQTGNPCAVTALAFDTERELLWAGTSDVILQRRLVRAFTHRFSVCTRRAA
jgi:hypothetical protein